jgi:hypothetical protein
LGRLQESANAFRGRCTRLSSPAQIEHEARIANGIATEASRCSLAPIQELLDFTK